ncbi:hypothetical protein FPOAC2_07655 [Fusarium poae]
MLSQLVAHIQAESIGTQSSRSFLLGLGGLLYSQVFSFKTFLALKVCVEMAESLGLAYQKTKGAIPPDGNHGTRVPFLHDRHRSGVIAVGQQQLATDIWSQSVSKFQPINDPNSM